MDEYSLFRPRRNRYLTRKVICPWMHNTYGADLLVLSSYAKENRNYRYVLILMDCFSKMIWVRKLLDKSGKHVARALDDIFKKNQQSPKFLQTDEGSL